jgi:poly(3-hydroxybutyrate) depolymerase
MLGMSDNGQSVNYVAPRPPTPSGVSSAGASGRPDASSAGTSGRPDASGTGGTGPGGSSGSGGSSGGSTGAVPSIGCGKTSTVTFATVPGESGTAVGTGQGGYVTVNGRGFAMRLPDNYDKNKPYWLIFGFHWNGGTSKDVDTGGSNGYIMAHFGLQKLSNNGAIFVAPQGNNNGWGGDNLPFVDDMVKLIEDNYCVDTTRLYSNGFSYGGGMSYAIACARAKVFRAVAIYEGAELSGCTGGNEPIAYWQMAGTTDTTCTISMATPMRDKFAKNNGCTIPTTEPPRPTSSTSPHICTDYTGCSSGHPLRWCVHPAGHGNAIVDGSTSVYNECATPPKTCSDTCKCTWVPADVWKFFTSL